MPQTITQDPRWNQILARDGQADGQFWYAVSTTGVYCRPSCPSRAANPENVSVYATLEEAKASGFRSCKRCNPDGLSVAAENAALIVKACRLIDEADETPSLADLAATVELSPFYFQRLFKSITGVTPKAYAQARRSDLFPCRQHRPHRRACQYAADLAWQRHARATRTRRGQARLGVSQSENIRLFYFFDIGKIRNVISKSAPFWNSVFGDPTLRSQEPTLGVGWKSVEELPKGDERDQIQRVLDKEYDCRGVPTKRLSLSGNNYDQFLAHVCQKAEIRKLLVDNNQDIIAIGLPSIGNCGDFNFTFLGPTDATSQRHVLQGVDRGRACAEGLRDVPGQSPFKIVVEGDDRPPGPHTNINVLFEWTGTDLEEVR